MLFLPNRYTRCNYRKRQSEIEYADVSSVKKARFTREGQNKPDHDHDDDEPEQEHPEARLPEFEYDPAAQPGATTTEARMDIDEEMPAAMDAPGTSGTSSGTFKQPKPVSTASSFVSGLSGNGAS